MSDLIENALSCTGHIYKIEWPGQLRLFLFFCTRKTIIETESTYSKGHSLQLHIYCAYFPHQGKLFDKLDPNTVLEVFRPVLINILKTLDKRLKRFTKSSKFSDWKLGDIRKSFPQKRFQELFLSVC